MDYDYALAFALANEALCIFAGAGLSKHLTNGRMPDWRELLGSACDELANPAAAKSQLTEARDNGYPLEDCAQILELAFLREGKDLRQALADLISKISADPSSMARVRTFLEAHTSVSVVTTNYDLLLEEHVLPGRCSANYPGKPVARKENAVDVFHVHGCVKNPSGMVATTNGYYEFINAPGYFAQKTATLMHENSMLIVGYSLSDPNLKAILNAFRSKEMRAINRGNLFFVTRDNLPAYVRDYYETAYGLTAIANTEIDSLLDHIDAKFPEAKARVENAVTDLTKVLAGEVMWNPEYLKLRDSLFHIFATANTIRRDIHSAEFRRMLDKILTKKVDFTRDKGAWEQYSHLAEWLVYLGSIMDLAGTPLEKPYLNAVKHSMKTMSKSYRYGYSWNAFRVWKNKWNNLTFRNRMLLREFADTQNLKEDALEVVLQ